MRSNKVFRSRQLGGGGGGGHTSLANKPESIAFLYTTGKYSLLCSDQQLNLAACYDEVYIGLLMYIP